MKKTQKIKSATLTCCALSAALALTACAGSGEGAGNTTDAASASYTQYKGAKAQAGDSVESKAVVVYNKDGRILFVGQDDGMPYTPTLTDDIIFDATGDDIDISELPVGSIVSVTGNGIMLDSYPGQYPGISKVEIIDAGTPANADKYADIIAQWLGAAGAAASTAEVPTGYIEYATDLAKTSLALEAYDYEWNVVGNDAYNAAGNPAGNNAANKLELDADFYNPQGLINDNINDARIAGNTDVTVGFSIKPTKISVEKIPLTNSATPTINPAAEDLDVPATMQQDGTAKFAIEAGYVYKIDVDFPGGEAEYAFYTR